MANYLFSAAFATSSLPILSSDGLAELTGSLKAAVLSVPS